LGLFSGIFFKVERDPTMNRRTVRVTSRLLSRRAAALKRHLPGALQGDARGVHQARVASRRLREAVPVLTAGVKGTKAGKARGKIRRLTRALGTVRELDVTVHVLDELAAKATLPRHALEQVRAHVVAERDERRTVMLKRLGQIKLDKLDRRLVSVTEALNEADSEEWRNALGSRLVKRAKALAASMSNAGHMYSPDQLHRVRIAAKKLRYAMELAAEAGSKGAAAPVRLLKRAQDTLGRLHDLQVLQSHVAAVQARPAVLSLPDAGLEILGRALEEQCRHLHARYVAMVPQVTPILESVRTVIVPQLARRAGARGRTLKMTLKQRPSIRRSAGRTVAAAGSAQR
jgi:CHAD domain-containing protein